MSELSAGYDAGSYGIIKVTDMMTVLTTHRLELSLKLTEVHV